MEHEKSHEDEHCLKCVINKNLEKETEAINDYYRLLDCDGLSEEDRKKIIEIVADEKNHQLILQAMVRNYDGGIEATKDDLKETIDGLTAKKSKAEPNPERKDVDFDDDAEVIFLTSFGREGKGKK